MRFVFIFADALDCIASRFDGADHALSLSLWEDLDFRQQI